MVQRAPARGRSGRAKRRTFTAAYKARIPREYDQAASPRERGAPLRREGLYTSHISDWRRSRDAGAENGLAERPGGRPGRSAADADNERLRKENGKLAAELARIKAALEVAGKARALGAALRERGLRREAAEVIDAAFTELETVTSVKRACELLGKSRATLHRQRNPRPPAGNAQSGPRAPHPATLTPSERDAVPAVLNSGRFADKSPAQVWAILLDEGIYLMSQTV